MPDTPEGQSAGIPGLDVDALAKRIAEGAAAGDGAEVAAGLNELVQTLQRAFSPLETFKTALAEGEIQRIFHEAAGQSASQALQIEVEPRLDRLKDDIKRGIDRATSDILAQVKGSIEGRIVAAVSVATSTKEFREVLREVTMWSAKQAVRDSGQPLLEEMLESAEASLKEGLKGAMKNAQASLEPAIAEGLAKYVSSAEFQESLSAAARPMVDEAVAGILGSGGEGGLREFVLSVVSEETDERIKEIKETVTGIRTNVVEAVESALGALQERLDDIEGESLRKLFEILSGLTSPQDLDERIRKVSGEGSEKIVKAMKAALDEVSKRVTNLLEKERERTRKLIEERAQTGVSDGGALPPNFEELMRTSAMSAIEKSGLSAEAVKAIFDNPKVQNKVVALAAADRRSAKDEIAALVREFVKTAVPAAGADGAPSVSEDLVRQLVSDEVSKALSSVKSLVKKLQPAVESEVTRSLREKMGAYPTVEQVETSLEGKVEELRTELLMSSGRSTSIDPDTIRETVNDAIKQQLDAVVEDLVQRHVKASLESSDALQRIAQQGIDKNVIKEAVTAVVESDLFTSFINSDHLKEMLDDKFKIMRNWLKNDELPRLVKKSKES